MDPLIISCLSLKQVVGCWESNGFNEKSSRKSQVSSGKRAGLDAAAAEGLWNAWFGVLDWQILWVGILDQQVDTQVD